MKEGRGITPLRTILQNCLNHIENLETNRSIPDNYDKEFQDLKQFSETLKSQKEYSCTEGEKEVNRKKNRYKDILPFNISRVILSEYAGIPGSDYINANYIKGASGSPAYIASQGPLPNTVNDFWRMVVECEVQVIVMACNAQESGKHKCENYWVEKEGEEKRFGMVQICLVKASIVCPDFLVRTMRLKYTNDKDVTEERTVCQFHYSAWPDHGVPPLVRPLLDMVRLVRDTQASETLPVLVHCSAGCGRTGTICAIDFVWGLLRAGKLTEEFSLFNLVRDMRKQRVAMVQTKEQYILVHQAVRELFKEQLRVIESHPYENIDFNGVPLIKDLEEPFYDTISIQKEESCDEKQDKSEVKEKGEEMDGRIAKIDSAPPLPRKKRPNVLFSKQEKEAENLTEKNRSSFVEKDREKEKADASLSSILAKPRIVKLRALFEKNPTAKDRTTLKDRGSQTVSRSHSLGTIRKPLTAEVFDTQLQKSKPSTLPQPQAEPQVKLKHSKSFSKSVPLIKRSKSLKTFSQSPHLCISPPVTVERKVVKNYQSKPENPLASGTSENVNKASPSFCDIPQASDLAKECSKRRRSLESLMGDAPVSVTWPTVVMSGDKSSSNLKNRQKSLDWSPKQSFSTIQGGKTSEILKHQLQRLSLETEKKINNFATGIGIRERRNSFRQAVTKSDFQNVFRDYREQQNLVARKVLSNETQWNGSKHNKNSSKVSQSVDQPDGVLYLEREAPVDVKLMRTKSFFDARRYKMHDKHPAEAFKKVNPRNPVQSDILGGPATIELRIPKSILMSKTSRTYEDLERSGDPKNLFLRKLNSELMSERERESGSSDPKSRSSYEETDKPSVSHYTTVPPTGHNDPKKSMLKINSSMKPTGSYSIKVDNFDDLDGPSSRFVRSAEDERPSWQTFHGQQTFVKPQKPAKPSDCYKCFTTQPGSHPTVYGKSTGSHKSGSYQSAVSDGKSGLRREEMPHKEPFVPLCYKKSIFSGASSKIHSSHESEVTFGSYRRNPNSELYLTVSPEFEFENGEKNLMLPPKSTAAADKNSKNYECLPWSHSSSQRSSSEMSSSDSKSEPSRLSESSGKPDVILVKKTEQGKGVNKIRVSDSSKVSLNSEPSRQKRPDDLKPSAEFCNYGVVGTSKIKQNPPKYSKDDFVLEEPTAPPRVKRHASVTVPRTAVNGSDHVTTWISSENKMGNNRNSNTQLEKIAWSGSFGVDLDAVAASIQQEKREASVLKDAVWTSKNHLSASGNSNGKKKQHYF